MQVVVCGNKELDEMLAKLPVEHQIVLAHLLRVSESRNEKPSDATIEAAMRFAERWQLVNRLSVARGLNPMTLAEVLALDRAAGEKPAGATRH